VPKGSVGAESIPLACYTIIVVMDHHQIVTKLVRNLARKGDVFGRDGGRLEGGSRSGWSGIFGTPAAAVNGPVGSTGVSSIHCK